MAAMVAGVNSINDMDLVRPSALGWQAGHRDGHQLHRH